MMAVTKLFLWSILLSVVSNRVTDISVETATGTFIGFSEDIDVYTETVKISKFLGIPYAEAPIGDLRFRKPLAKKPLTDPLKTQRFGNACLQVYLMSVYNQTDSEDCLYLNIFKPESAVERLPVMVWIHGGGFVLDSSNNYTGDALAANGPVIVVTLNYRLSVWGFLSTEDATSPGNYGLWDQHLAISWVHEHIEAFGGDPTRVTIFGESAGGSSVILQGLYPDNIGLFHRIIAESGNAVSPWAIRPNPKNDAKKLATLVGCETYDTEYMLGCLRRIPYEQINITVNNLELWEYNYPYPFIPSVDGVFIPEPPRQSLLDPPNIQSNALETFSSFDLMIGFNSGEGLTVLEDIVPKLVTDLENFLPNKSYFENTVSLAFGEDAPSLLNDALIAEYTDWDDPENPDSIRERICEMLCDWALLGNTYRTIQSHATRSIGRSYLFYFKILPFQSIVPRATWFNQPLHFDELLYVFGNGMRMTDRAFQPWEKAAAHNIMTMWTNFAKTGNPVKPRDIGVEWLPYTLTNHRYLEIVNDVTASKVKERLKQRRAIYWDTILPGMCEVSKPNSYKEECIVKEECRP